MLGFNPLDSLEPLARVLAASIWPFHPSKEYGWCGKPVRDSMRSLKGSHSVYIKALGSALKFLMVNLGSSFLGIIIF